MVLSWTLDKIGPLALSSNDVEIITQNIIGKDNKDPYSIENSFNLINKIPKNLKIGIPDGITDNIQNEVKGCKLEFLNQQTNRKADDLIKDRKIQDGVDKRTYQVNFDRIHEQLPNFKAKWDVPSGVNQLLGELVNWRLDDIKFKQREFYRLQQVEHLLETKQFEF